MSQQSDKHAGHHNFLFFFFINFIFETEVLLLRILHGYSENLCSGN